MHNRNSITRAALGCAVALLVATTSAWGNNGNCRKPHKLGGAWVGTTADGSVQFSYSQAPLDPLGQTAVVKIQWLTNTSGLVELQDMFGVHASEAVGTDVMIDRDTCKYTLVWYGLANESPDEIRVIYVLSGTIDFKGPDLGVSQETLKIYFTNSGAAGFGLPDADANHDLLPDPGAVPYTEVPFQGTTHRRVPILP